MSALDQAFIRAYTKDVPNVAPSDRMPETHSSPQINEAVPANSVGPRKYLYHRDDVFAGAVWFRSDKPADPQSAISQPHFEIPSKEEQSEFVHGSSQTAATGRDDSSRDIVCPELLSEPDGYSGPIVKPVAQAASSEHNAESMWVMPPTISPTVSEKAESLSDPITEKETVEFGRIDLPHTNRVPAPHFSVTRGRKREARQGPDADISRGAVIDQVAETETNIEISSEKLDEVVQKSTDFHPAWEVQRIRWPKLCDQLIDVGRKTFDEIIETLQGGSAKKCKIVAVTSQQRGEGRTTISLCAARYAASAGLNCLLIDADFSNPQIANRMQLNVPRGWESAVVGKSPLAETAVVSVDDSLTVLPLGKGAKGHHIGIGEVGESDSLSDLSREFDLIVVDTGPFPARDGSIFDAVLIVRDLRCTSVEDVDELVSEFIDTGVEVLGVVENFG
jgi:Mrp family chromosome partitioning ATPase